MDVPVDRAVLLSQIQGMLHALAGCSATCGPEPVLRLNDGADLESLRRTWGTLRWRYVELYSAESFDTMILQKRAAV